MTERTVLRPVVSSLERSTSASCTQEFEFLHWLISRSTSTIFLHVANLIIERV